MYTLDVIISFDYGRSSTVELDSGNINVPTENYRLTIEGPGELNASKCV